MSGKYDDIILLKYHKSTKHPPMSIENRAAQFSPFAALVGYDDALKETARTTKCKIELTEDEKTKLDEILSEIMAETSKRVKITYYEKDPKKEGGYYKTTVGTVKKIDEYKKVIRLTSGFEITFCDVYDIERIE